MDIPLSVLLYFYPKHLKVRAVKETIIYFSKLDNFRKQNDQFSLFLLALGLNRSYNKNRHFLKTRYSNKVRENGFVENSIVLV